MNVKIIAVRFDASEKLQKFVESKVSKLSHFYDNIMGADVYLRVEVPQQSENKLVEIKLDVPGVEFFAKKQADSFEEATDLAVEALKNQIQKHKDKYK